MSHIRKSEANSFYFLTSRQSSAYTALLSTDSLSQLNVTPNLEAAMTYQVVLIFKENDDFNVCLLPFPNYPYLRVPAQGDIVPLVAKATIQTQNRHGAVDEEQVTYLDGLYEVVTVWPGRGQGLHPTPGFDTYPLSNELEGYGVQVRTCTLPGYDDIPKSEARLIEGTWPPVAAR